MKHLLPFLAVLLLAGPGSAADPQFTARQKQAVIDALTPRLQNTMGREAWQDLVKRWQPRLQAAETASGFYATVNQMLRSAGKSHFMLVPPELQAASDRQSKDLRGRLGITAGLVEGQVVIIEIHPQSPAQKAGLRPGFIIQAIDNWKTRDLLQHLRQSGLPPAKQTEMVTNAVRYRLAGPPESTVKLQYLDAANRSRTRSLTRALPSGKVVQYGNLPSWRMTFEARRLAGGNVGYIRFNIFLMPLLKAIKKAVKDFHDCRGIILDLRDNPGGFGMMAIPVASLFYDKRTSLGESKLTESNIRYTIFPHPKPYRGRVIILTNAGTASTSEVLAAGMQENGRARIVGQRTMGAVLPSLIVKLPTGAQLQYPIGDFKTPKGKPLEGVGVTPDVTVTLTRKDLLELGDPVLTRAVKLLSGNTESKGP